MSLNGNIPAHSLSRSMRLPQARIVAHAARLGKGQLEFAKRRIGAKLICQFITRLLDYPRRPGLTSASHPSIRLSA